MNNEVAHIIKEWLQKGISWQTARGYDMSIRRMIKDNMLPDIYKFSLKEFYALDHGAIIKALKARKELTYHAAENTASAYRSLVKYIKEHYPIPCCEHECKKDQ